jgi:dihydroorotase
VTPHHLLLDSTANLGTRGKVNPPLRRREDRQALFHALVGGGFDTIASDHAPHTLDEKQEDFDYAPSGMPGVETMVPMLLHHVREKHLALNSVVSRVCERPAQIFGLNKGRIAEGFDADLVVVDLAMSSEIKADRMHSRCGWTAFEGMSGIFPRAVFVRGEMMIDNGSLVGDQKGWDVVGRKVTD